MRSRVFFAYLLIRLGRFMQSLAVMVMRPDDLVEFSRRTYSKSKCVESWGKKDMLDSGLSSNEMDLLKKVCIKEGRLLLLGVGGGREAIPLVQKGFEVTGVDFIPEMVEKSIKNATQRGLKINGVVQEISKLNFPNGSFDIVWLSAAMYSCVPTEKRRVEMLKKIHRILKSEGCFVCQFHIDERSGFSQKVEFARKVFGFFTLGNLWYEKGDMLWGDVEFIHAFSSEDELRSEFKNGGFEVVHLHIPERGIRGGAVMKRK